MAGIEKICEFDGHWPEGDDGDYRNTLQICKKHHASFREKVQGKPHKIVFGDSWWGLVASGRKLKNVKYTEFEVIIDGVEHNGSPYMRWFYDKRQWKRKMRKLLGVKRLNLVV